MLIEAEDSTLSIVKQCELLSISRSGLYYKPVPESEENLAIMRWIPENAVLWSGAPAGFIDMSWLQNQP